MIQFWRKAASCKAMLAIAIIDMAEPIDKTDTSKSIKRLVPHPVEMHDMVEN